MDIIGIVVITIVMACAVAGAIASLRNSESGLGKEFLEGLHAIGYIFVPVAGIMASIPFLAWFVRETFGRLYVLLGADPAMAATSFIAVDMGGYQLARGLTASHESWIMAMTAGYMAGATIVFSIPVGLSLLEKKDHKYMALGILSGLLSIPIGVLIASLLAMALTPMVRTVPATGGTPDYQLALDFATIFLNLSPLVVLVGLLAIGLWMFPDAMIRGFMAFGRFMDIAIKLVLVACIVQYFTTIFYKQGIFTTIFGGWGFDPIIADADQIEGALTKAVKDGTDPVAAVPASSITRALEVAGYIGIMLAGAFPMVYLLKKHLARPMEAAGRKLGLSAVGAAGILAAVANILAMFRLIKDMPPKDKVLCIAFGVCAAFLFGDHLAFTANFQPNMLMPVMLGKLSGGVFAFWLAYRLSVPKALELERQEMDQHVKPICELIPRLQGKEVTFKRLSGGLTNFNYLIYAGDEKYVLRISSAATGLLGIDRKREVACSEAAFAAKVGPEVVAFLPDIPFLLDHSALLIGFCPGTTLEPEHFTQDGLLHRVGETLRRCHDQPVPADLGEFCPFKTVHDYQQLTHERRATGQTELPAELPKALERFGKIKTELATGHAPCLCHNDLLAANFIDDGVNIRIIDWEYGGLGDRFFDLGNLAVNLQLTESQEEALLRSYFGAARPEDLRRLRLMRLVSDMREATWGLLQARISIVKPPQEYMEHGRKHLERFLLASERML